VTHDDHASSDAPLVPVATAFNPVEAQLIQMRLQQAGIAAQLADENLASMHYGLGIAAGGVKVLVPASDVAAAQEVLAAEPVPLDLECPSCGSKNVQHETHLSRGTTVALGFLVGAPLPDRQHRIRCTDCGHTWEE
jgi:DNA-directed RNA polymerase subunit RPC12/RpoP